MMSHYPQSSTYLPTTSTHVHFPGQVALQIESVLTGMSRKLFTHIRVGSEPITRARVNAFTRCTVCAAAQRVSTTKIRCHKSCILIGLLWSIAYRVRVEKYDVVEDEIYM